MRFIIPLVLFFYHSPTMQANAQFAGQNLPGLKGLREVFGDVASGKTRVDEIRESNGLLDSGITAPDTGARGNMAKAIGDLIGQEVNDAQVSTTLEKAFLNGSIAAENALPGLGFQKRDFGVGFALFFILSWEMANKTTLSEEASKVASANIVKSIQTAGEGQDATAEELDAGYDMLLTIPVAMLALVEVYEAEGQMEEAVQMHEFAANAFEQIIELSPYDIDITDGGEIIGY